MIVQKGSMLALKDTSDDIEIFTNFEKFHQIKI
jgi:hypothetical protein